MVGVCMSSEELCPSVSIGSMLPAHTCVYEHARREDNLAGLHTATDGKRVRIPACLACKTVFCPSSSALPLRPTAS
jgi:hypothetical protein